jgi:hypothetical protein
MSMKKYSDTIGHRSRDLPVCSSVPQPTTAPRTPLQKRVTGIIPGGKSGRCVRLTNLPPSCADCLKIWEPQPAGTLRACHGLLWDFFTFTFTQQFTVTSQFPQIFTPWIYNSLRERDVFLRHCNTDRDTGSAWLLHKDCCNISRAVADPNSQFRRIYIRNNLIRKQFSLISKSSETLD